MTKLRELIKKLIRESLLEADNDPEEDDLPPDEGDEEDLSDEEPGDDAPEDIPANSTGDPNNPETTPPPNGPQVFYATADNMADLIRKTKGKIFTVEFTKRTDGSDRIMNARLGVKAYLHGGVLPYDPNEKNLIPCFDMQKRAYRMISIEGIKSLKIGQNIYVLPGTVIKEVLLLKEYLNESNFRERLGRGIPKYSSLNN